MTACVLYLGDRSGTSLHRADAFLRMGYKVVHISPRELLPASIWVDRLEWHFSPYILSKIIYKKLLGIPELKKVDFVWVDSGSLISRELLELFHKLGKPVVNFNHDDPYGPRDWIRFSEYRRAVPAYTLIVVVREPNVQEAITLGAKDIILVTRTADEIAHFPRQITPQIRKEWESVVSFVGTWMPERGPFLAELIDRGVPLSIFGSGWQKAPEWIKLKPFHRKKHLEGDDYAYAVQCSKISLGLLSKGNRDLHTTRSVEIPMLGGLLCAERTSEHLAMYNENIEAIFWDDAEECAAKCFEVINENQDNGINIAFAGRKKVLSSKNTSEGLISKVIERLGI